MTWIDSLRRRWGWVGRRQQLLRDRRLAAEALEGRDMPAAGFLQGFSFVDANGNGVRDDGDLPKPGATIQLQDSAGNVVKSTTTAADGYYRLNNVAPGTYKLVELPPAGYASQGTDIRGLLDTGTQVAPNAIQVTVVASDPAGLTVNRTPGIAGGYAGATTAYNLTGGSLNQYTNSPNNLNAHQFQLSLSSASGPIGSSFYSYCVDLFHTNPANFAVSSSASSFIPSSSGLPATSDANLGRIGYLYNTYGNKLASSGADGAALQLAIYELLYDANPNFDSGNFTLLSGTDAAVRTAAQHYLDDSAGKDERAIYLNVTDGNAQNCQGMLATEQFNFVNKLLPPPPPPPPTTACLSGSVYLDCNHNGKRDAGELGIPGVTVTLTGPGGLTLTTKTDCSGNYSFCNLAPGTYKLVETQPAGLLQGTTVAGTLGGTVTGDTISGIVVAGVSGRGYDFGELTKCGCDMGNGSHGKGSSGKGSGGKCDNGSHGKGSHDRCDTGSHGKGSQVRCDNGSHGKGSSGKGSSGKGSHAVCDNGSHGKGSSGKGSAGKGSHIVCGTGSQGKGSSGKGSQGRCDNGSAGKGSHVVASNGSHGKGSSGKGSSVKGSHAVCDASHGSADKGGHDHDCDTHQVGHPAKC